MFAVFSADVNRTCEVLDNTEFKYVLNTKCGKVTVVGNAMRGVPGVMATFVAALALFVFGSLPIQSIDDRQFPTYVFGNGSHKTLDR